MYWLLKRQGKHPVTYYWQYKILTSMHHLQGHVGSHLWFCWPHFSPVTFWCSTLQPHQPDGIFCQDPRTSLVFPPSGVLYKMFLLLGVFIALRFPWVIFSHLLILRDFPLTLLSGRFPSSPISSLRTLVLLFLHSNYYNRLIFICSFIFPCSLYWTLRNASVCSLLDLEQYLDWCVWCADT